MCAASERFVAETSAKNRKIIRQEFGETHPVSIIINCKKGRSIRFPRIRDRGENGPIVFQNCSLELRLQFGESHTATSSIAWLAAVAIDRARSSSVKSSSKGGKLASRSIIVEMDPKRRQAFS